MTRTIHLDSYTQSRTLEQECYHPPFDPPTMRSHPKGSLLFSDTQAMLARFERDWDDRVIHGPVGRLIQLRISSILRAHLDAAVYETLPFTPDERSLMAIEKWSPAEDWSSWIDATG